MPQDSELRDGRQYDEARQSRSCCQRSRSVALNRRLVPRREQKAIASFNAMKPAHHSSRYRSVRVEPAYVA
jgi:hypothetical protein